MEELPDEVIMGEGDKIYVEQPRMSEVAVSHPVEGTLSTEGAPRPAAVQEYHVSGAQ